MGHKESRRCDRGRQFEAAVDQTAQKCLFTRIIFIPTPHLLTRDETLDALDSIGPSGDGVHAAVAVVWRGQRQSQKRPQHEDGSMTAPMGTMRKSSGG